MCGTLSDLPRKEIPDWISHVKSPLKFWMLLCLWNTLLLAQAAPRNIILILSDDHRYDFMSFMEQSPSFLETPHLDRMAAQGVHFRNAFVTTSLCSPSRATILTGQYMHHHRVVDNQRPVAEGTRFFPQYLQQAGYQTAFVGKWHMGHDHDDPRSGFHHWVSFKGQGTYADPELNINGQRRVFEGYTTDVLTDQAIDWLKTRDSDQPFLLYLSYKAVHYPFQPAPRHLGRYASEAIDYPMTMANTEANYQTQSNWIRARRYGIHGIDHMETGPLDKDPVPSFDDLYHQYAETVHGLDENVGRVLDQLEEQQLLDESLVVYLGDNGFALGEHGFYDKRDAFETSIRIPMLAMAPGLIQPGTQQEAMVLNMDLASTFLEVGGIALEDAMALDGRSMLPLMRGESVPWRDHILYEYHWEWNFPATPTTLAIRGDRYKYIYYHGVWDRNGFYDLETDPHEQINLIQIPAFQDRIAAMRNQLFEELEASGGLVLPIRPPKGVQFYDRKLPR